ncbi:hypothetical protein CS542_08175 [Pedobacter sp. IW39]|nr:hypothetical protein CS542_08175 [Pedobacter sp. IW39]
MLEKKSGSSSEINLYCSIFDAAGLKVILLSSVQEVTAHWLSAGPASLHYCMTITGDKNLLDAVKTIPRGSYPNLNHRGLKINRTDNAGEWISTEMTRRETVYFYNLTLDTENKLKGTLSISEITMKVLMQGMLTRPQPIRKNFLKL